MENKFTKPNTLDSEYRRALKPDAQGFDEIRLVTIPRYKTSGLSGNEWRISVVAQFFRKGQLILEDTLSNNMENATAYLAWKYANACDNGNALFCGEGNTCDQEGCSKEATVVYQLTRSFCHDGHATTLQEPVIRLFCDKHKQRGDCGLDDADENYTKIN